jgi:hypothetical protein
MPTLSVTKSYADGDILLEADLDAIRTSIQTFFNTTKIDDDNIQNAGITRATKLKSGTANHVLINDASGLMSSESALDRSRGGTGLSVTLSSADANKVIAVNSAGSAFEVAVPQMSVAGKCFAYLNFA